MCESMAQTSAPPRRAFLKASGLTLAAFVTSCHVSAPGGQDVILIKNGRLVDGTGKPPLQPAFILIEGGKFREISASAITAPVGAAVIDAAGKTILPGLIDMHAHLLSGGFDTISEKSMSYDPADQQRALKQMLYWGVTAVNDPVQPLESGLQLRSQVLKQAFPSPRLFISGPGFTAPGGWAGSSDSAARIEPKDLNDVKRQVGRLADERVDFLKVFYDDMSDSFSSTLPKLDRRRLEEIINEAHARRLRVMVHAYSTEDHKTAIRAGADIMAHSAITGPVNDEYIALARKNKTMYLATLSVYHDVFNEKVIREFIGQDFVRKTVPKKTLDTLTAKEPLDSFEKTIKQDYIKQQLPTILNNLKRVSESGVAIGVGPDTGVPGSFPGLAVHREMELMVAAGMPPAAVMVAATRTAAEYLGQSSLGTVERGKAADVVIVSGDPLQDITNTRNITAVIKEGRIVNREQLLRETLG